MFSYWGYVTQTIGVLLSHVLSENAAGEALIGEMAIWDNELAQIESSKGHLATGV